MRAARVLCHICGCAFDEGVCRRCGGEYYEDFIHDGLVERVTGPLFRIKRLVWPTCNQCGKRLLFRERHHGGYFCSEACFQEWLPF